MINKKERPLVKRRIEALLSKTEANGCTSGEAKAALDKAKELATKYRFTKRTFQWPPEPLIVESSEPHPATPRKSSAASAVGRGKGIGALAKQMIIDHPEWNYTSIAIMVNRSIPGAAASEKSVRWYAHQLRKSGVKTTRKPIREQFRPERFCEPWEEVRKGLRIIS